MNTKTVISLTPQKFWTEFFAATEDVRVKLHAFAWERAKAWNTCACWNLKSSRHMNGDITDVPISFRLEFRGQIFADCIVFRSYDAAKELYDEIQQMVKKENRI